MITNNPEHKKATLKKLIQAGKIALSVSLAGTVATVTIFIHTNIIKKYDIEFEDDLGMSHSLDASVTEMILGEIEDSYADSIIEDYNQRLEENEKEKKQNATKQNMTLVYDANKTDSDIVNLSDNYRADILRALNRGNDVENPEIKITVSDLKQLQKLEDTSGLTVRDDSDISWLNYCTNLYSLEVELISEKAVEKLKQIEQLNLSKFAIFSNIKTYKGNAIDINEENFSFLKNCSDYLSVSLESRLFSVNSDYLQQLIQQKKCVHLTLSDLDAMTQKINVDKLKKFTSVTIIPTRGSGVYDIATIFSRNEFEELFNSDFDLIIKLSEDSFIDTEQYLLEVRKTYDQIDNIINGLNINENMNQQEKINVVLEYVLKNLSYNPTMKDMIIKGENKVNEFGMGSNDYINEHKKSYLDGYLYGVLNENGEAICGNYAALINVLLTQVGVESFFVYSQDHAYNLINVDGEYYYLDATFLDQDVIDMDEIINNNLSLKSPAIPSDTYDTLVTPAGVVMPTTIDVEERVQEIINNVKKEYLIKFNNQFYNVSFTVLMSILAGLGLAISKRKLEQLERKEEIDLMDDRDKIDVLTSDFKWAKLEYDEANPLKKAYLKISGQANFEKMQEEIDEVKGIKK